MDDELKSHGAKMKVSSTDLFGRTVSKPLKHTRCDSLARRGRPIGLVANIVDFQQLLDCEQEIPTGPCKRKWPFGCNPTTWRQLETIKGG